jgi:hypothetical protein
MLLQRPAIHSQATAIMHLPSLLLLGMPCPMHMGLVDCSAMLPVLVNCWLQDLQDLFDHLVWMLVVHDWHLSDLFWQMLALIYCGVTLRVLEDCYTPLLRCWQIVGFHIAGAFAIILFWCQCFCQRMSNLFAQVLILIFLVNDELRLSCLILLPKALVLPLDFFLLVDCWFPNHQCTFDHLVWLPVVSLHLSDLFRLMQARRWRFCCWQSYCWYCPILYFGCALLGFLQLVC